MQPAELNLDSQPVADIDLIYQELLDYCGGNEELAARLYHDGPDSLKEVKADVKRLKR